MFPVEAPSTRHLAQRASERIDAPISGSRTRSWRYPTVNDDANAPKIILVHGFRGTHHGLLPLVAELPNVEFLAPDLPGFGESTPLEGKHNLHAYSRWLGRYLERVDPKGQAILLGHSFGSLVIARNPSVCGSRRIVLVNPIASPALEGPDRFATQLAIAYYRLGAWLPASLGQRLMASRLITRVMSEVMATTHHSGLRRWIHEEHDRHFSNFFDRTTLLDAFRASVSDSVTAHAHEFPAGTVLVAGERDQIAPVAAQRLLVERMPGSSLYVIAGVGHLIHYETPRALARVLRETLDIPGERLTPSERGAATR